MKSAVKEFIEKNLIKDQPEKKVAKRVAKPKVSKFIEIKIGDEKLSFLKTDLAKRMGVHKAVVNTVLPWVKKELEKGM